MDLSRKGGRVAPVNQDHQAFSMNPLPPINHMNHANANSTGTGAGSAQSSSLMMPLGATEKFWKEYKSQRRIIHDSISKGTPIDEAQSRHEVIGLGLAPNLKIDLFGCFETTASGNQDMINQEIHSTLNRNLIQYFARLSDCERPESFIDLEFVESLVQSGADIGSTDSYGQTPLHEVARSWCVDAARFLVNELNADVNAGDIYGRTPLHVAASVNYTEMVDFLIASGADIEAATVGEGQTPIFFAARYDALDSMKTLLKHGCRYKRITDYKNRSPLAVAAELNRHHAAQLLLDMEAPSDICDDSGQPAVAALVANVGSETALNQFHRIDRKSRRQFYYLGKLDPTTPEQVGTLEYSGVLQSIVSHARFDLVMHPVIIRLIEVNWFRFAQKRQILEILIQILFVVSWSCISVYPNWIERHIYIYPVDIWRWVVIALALLMTVWQVIQEFLEYRNSRAQHAHWKKWKLSEIERDEFYCHPRWPEEKQFLDMEKSVLDKTAPYYFKDTWNIFDITCYLMILGTVIVNFMNYVFHSLILGRWCVRCLAVLIIFLWLRLMKVVRPFAAIGTFIIILGHITVDTMKFLFIYAELFIPFSLAFYMLYYGSNPPDTVVGNIQAIPENASMLHVTGFSNVGLMAFSVFRITIVSDMDVAHMLKIDPLMTPIIITAWIFISGILLLNLFIALMSDTFSRVYDNARANAMMQKAAICLWAYDNLYESSKRQFHCHIQGNCNPEILHYADSNVFRGDDHIEEDLADTMKVVNEIHELIVMQMSDHKEDDIAAAPQPDKEQETVNIRRKSVLLNVASLGGVGGGGGGGGLQRASSPQPQPHQFADVAGAPSGAIGMGHVADSPRLASLEREIAVLRDIVHSRFDDLKEVMDNDLEQLKTMLKDMAVIVAEKGSERPPKKKREKRKRTVTFADPPTDREPSPPPYPTDVEVGIGHRSSLALETYSDVAVRAPVINVIGASRDEEDV